MSQRLADLDRKHVWHPFTPMAEWMASEPLIIERAEGSYLVDTEGRRYLDGVSSLWVNVHGHRKAAIDEAIREQLERVAHTTLLGLASVPSIELAARLIAVAPEGLTRVFYSDSGSTAVEVALKVAYQYQRQRGAPERSRFGTLAGAYHGDTIGSVSLGGMDLFHATYRALLFESLKVDPQDLGALDAFFEAHGGELAAFVMEPLVQGAAGMILQPPGFLRRVRELCDAHDVLLVLDEVATGFGRTGTLFACEQEGVRPDVLCLAKGITGGTLPLAATLFTEAIHDAFLGAPEEARTFFHGHTYTGNPLACAAAIASLRLFEEERTLERLQPKIAQLSRRLEALAARADVVEVRQRGFMVGIELESSDPLRRRGVRVCAKMRERGVIVRPLGDVVVLMPPLAISGEELEQLLDVTAWALEEVPA
ncbi:MAG: adenosylmethionine--8-amino-7-oxononanoate transaminase [Deltaproteobacteria bacterium]|nr:adenosylmethionine--8-amino-7-oxononanoate transaminase [Deltaproteobacteria bacterium]